MDGEGLSRLCLAAAKRAPTRQAEARWLARAFLVTRPGDDDAVKPRIAERLGQLRGDGGDPGLAFLHDAVRGLVDTEVGAVTGLRHLGLAASRFGAFDLGGDPVHASLQARVLIAMGRPEQVRSVVSGCLVQSAVSAHDRAGLAALAAQAEQAHGHVLRAESALLDAVGAHERLPLAGSDDRLSLECELVIAQALRGDVAGARHRLTLAAGGRRASRPAWHRGLIATAHAVLHWLDRDAHLVVDALTPVVEGRLVGDTALDLRVRLELATAHVGHGRAQQARRVLAGAGFSSSAGEVGRAMHAWAGWLDRPDDLDRLAILEHAAAELTSPADGLLSGRLNWLVGSALAECGQRSAAVAALVRSRGAFELVGAGAVVPLLDEDIATLGVVPLQRRAEHAPAQGRHRAPGLLTADEVRVTVAASDGLNTLDAAARLALPVKEVEEHLTEALEKLGVDRKSVV